MDIWMRRKNAVWVLNFICLLVAVSLVEQRKRILHWKGKVLLGYAMWILLNANNSKFWFVLLNPLIYIFFNTIIGCFNPYNKTRLGIHRNCHGPWYSPHPPPASLPCCDPSASDCRRKRQGHVDRLIPKALLSGHVFLMGLVGTKLAPKYQILQSQAAGHHSGLLKKLPLVLQRRGVIHIVYSMYYIHPYIIYIHIFWLPRIAMLFSVMLWQCLGN